MRDGLTTCEDGCETGRGKRRWDEKKGVNQGSWWERLEKDNLKSIVWKCVDITLKKVLGGNFMWRSQGQSMKSS